MAIFKKKKQDNYWLYGIGGGVLEAVYCFFIAVLIQLLDSVMSGPAGVFNFLLVLLMLVFSAAISGLLIFGYPVLLVMKKKYLEAIFTVLLSVSTLIIIGLLIVILKVIF